MKDNKEWMIHIWGGAWNYDANPSIERDLGIKEGYHYFKSEEDKNEFVAKLHNPIYRNQGLMIIEKYGEMVHKRTIFVGIFQYQDKEYVIHYDFGYEYSEEDAEFQFLENNYSCDYNRSLFIQREYGEDAIPELNCGNEIELKDYHFEYWD